MGIHPINDLADAVERAPFRTRPIILSPFIVVLLSTSLASIQDKGKTLKFENDHIFVFFTYFRFSLY